MYKNKCNIVHSFSCFFLMLLNVSNNFICKVTKNKIYRITMTTTQWENNEEIKIFQEYLRIPSVHPNIDFGKRILFSIVFLLYFKCCSLLEPCVDFLKRQAASLNLECQVHRLFHEKFPIIIITWIRLNPELPTIMLNSHMDVVPVFENFWTHPPFAAEIDGNGRIYARGSQDMKCVAVQYLAAIRALKRAGKRLKRSLHLVFVPDEETDAKNGTSKLVHHDVFKALNIGFALDEGMASETDVYKAFYGERSNWSEFNNFIKTGIGLMFNHFHIFYLQKFNLNVVVDLVTVRFHLRIQLARN